MSQLLPKLKENLGNIKLLSVGKLFSTYKAMRNLKSIFYFAMLSQVIWDIHLALNFLPYFYLTVGGFFHPLYSEDIFAQKKESDYGGINTS